MPIFATKNGNAFLINSPEGAFLDVSTGDRNSIECVRHSNERAWPFFVGESVRRNRDTKPCRDG